MMKPTMRALPCPPEHWPAFSRLLDEALELPAHERAAWLERLDGDDARLKPWLGPVLETVVDGDDAYLSSAPPIPQAKHAAVADTGQRLGPWRLRRSLGRGGMGEVWLADRADDAYAREVALKLPHAHLSGEGQRHRFERERDILAGLQHANIAQFFDAGLADNGQPWLALEYVRGDALLDWCDTRALDIAARIRLLLPICDAVQAAHRNLVVHRDIKPVNILVNDDGHPKLLDFGIARLIDDAAPDQTRTLAMTPAYATPEQRRGDAVTTASDVYQLGLVLFELLGGTPAHRGHDGHAGHPIQRMDAIFAALLASQPVQAGTIAQQRSLSPARLRATLAGDLSRIVAKALANDPAERYGSAIDLADDLQRFLDKRPVRARRSSLGYLLRRFARRHARALAIVSALLLALVVSIVTSERNARKHLAEVTAERSQARASLDFLAGLFDSAGPNGRHGPDASARDVLFSGVEKLRGESALSRSARSELLIIIGESLNSLSRVNDARTAFDLAAEQQRGFMPTTGQRLRLQLRQAINAHDRGDLDAARAQAEVLIVEPTDTGDPGPAAYRMEAHALLANIALVEGRPDDGLAALAPALAALDHGDVAVRAEDSADVRLLHGLLLNEKGRHDEAQRELENALALFRQAGDDHPTIGKTLASLALIHQDRGELAAADALFIEGNRSLERALGRDSRDLMIGRGNHSSLLLTMGEAQRAADEVLECLRIGAALALDDPLNECRLRNRLGQSLVELGDRTGARAEFEAALTLATRIGDDVIIARATLGLAYLACLDGSMHAIDNLAAVMPDASDGSAWRLRAGVYQARCLDARGIREPADRVWRALAPLVAPPDATDALATEVRTAIARR